MFESVATALHVTEPTAVILATLTLLFVFAVCFIRFH
jgi:hypothetical protein